jgi:hyperosmotically inducible protein
MESLREFPRSGFIGLIPAFFWSPIMKTRSTPFLIAAGVISAAALLVSGCSKPETAVSAPAATTTVGTEIDDTVVTASVKSALLTDADIKSFDFQVETRKGEVQLSGFAQNQAQIDRAMDLTRNVKGVKSVDNKLSLKGAPTSVGVGVDDGIVTARVKAAFMNDPDVKSIDVAVVTRKGEVQLSGFVNDQKQMDRAMVVARGVENVTSVSNEMSIKK